MSRILIVGQHFNSKLDSGVPKTVAVAKAIGGDIDIVILAVDGSAVASQAAKIDSVTRVLQIDRAENSHGMTAILAPQLVALAQSGGYSHMLVPGNTFGKDLAPRVAAKLGVQQVSDIMAVHGATSFARPIYAGNAVQTIEMPAEPCIVATVRLASFAAVGEGGSAPIEKITVDAELPMHTRFVNLEAHRSARPDLQSAVRVVSGGRALSSGENFRKLMEPLADKLGAGIGASRAAVDSGYCANDLQVGQTGKIIAPDLYFAIGISGAIQHLAGIKDARTIVAINKDPEAPIFEVADYGLVGDLFEVIPEMISKL